MLFAAASFDLRQHFIDRGIFCECLAEGCVETLQQVGHGFIIATHVGDAHFLALGSQRRATDRRDLTDGYLTARVVEEGLDMLERRGGGEQVFHMRTQAANAFVTCAGWFNWAATFHGSSSSMRLIG